jgi:hypothetical protein
MNPDNRFCNLFASMAPKDSAVANLTSQSLTIQIVQCILRQKSQTTEIPRRSGIGAMQTMRLHCETTHRGQYEASRESPGTLLPRSVVLWAASIAAWPLRGIDELHVPSLSLLSHVR